MGRRLKKIFDSSSIAQVKYDPSDHVLEVYLRTSGRCYMYFGVPREIYNGLLEADSKAAYLNQVIKPNFEEVRNEILG